MEEEKILSLDLESAVSLSLADDFKSHLEEKKKSTAYTPSYGYGGGYNRYASDDLEEKNDRVIYFYEFSNVMSTPKRFEKVSDFLQWARGYNVWVSTYSERVLKTHPVNFVSCYKDSASVCVKHSFQELRNSLERFAMTDDDWASRYPYYDDAYEGYPYYDAAWD